MDNRDNSSTIRSSKFAHDSGRRGVNVKPHTTYLGQFLALVMRQQCLQRLESGVDALHTTSLVAVGDFSPYSLLLLHVAARRGTVDVGDTVAVAQRNVLTSNPSASSDVTFGLLLLVLWSVSGFGNRHARGYRAVVYRLDASANIKITNK